MIDANRTLAHLDADVAVARRSRAGRLLRQPRSLAYSKLLETFCRVTGRSVVAEATTFFGASLGVVFPERVSMAIYRYGFYEEDATRFLLGHLRPGMTFVDVGAHIGYFSALAAELVGDEGSVHSFEPTPKTFSVLKRNLAHRSNVRLNECAAYSRSGSVSFTDFGPRYSAFNTLSTSRLEERELSAADERVVAVDAVTLDDYVAERDATADVLKIDAEGAELEVLGGAARLLEEQRPFIVLEVGDVGAAGSTGRSRELVDYLLRRGYTSWEVQRGGLRRHEVVEHYGHMNLIFVPAETSAGDAAG